MRIKPVHWIGVVAVLWLGVGCGSGSSGEPNYNDEYQYVVKQIMVPETAGHAQLLARDIDGDGKKENALGQFFSFLQTMAIPHGCEQTVNSSISLGKTLLLLQAKANLTAAGKGGAGSAADGGAAGDAAVLVMSSGKDLNGDITDNLDGKGEFTPDGKYKATLTGVISNMALAAGRGKAFLPLAPGGKVTTVSLQQALLEGKLTTASLDQAVLSGGIPWDQFKLLLMPGIASVLNCVVNTPIGGGG